MFAALAWGLVEVLEALSAADITAETMYVVDAASTAVVGYFAVEGGDGLSGPKRTRGRNTSAAPPKKTTDNAETATTPTTGGTDNHAAAVDVYDHYMFESPCFTPDDVMSPVNKRPITPIETPKPKRLDREEKRDRDVNFTGPSYSAGWCRDFSGIQRTVVNPLTGRIIGYKGIRRKRTLSPTSKYSSFWRDQKYTKPSLHASRSPGIWDSARR